MNVRHGLSETSKRTNQRVATVRNTSITLTLEPGLMVEASSPSSSESKVWESQIQALCGLPSEFKAILGSSGRLYISK